MSLGRTDDRGAASGFLWALRAIRRSSGARRVRRPCAPASSALPKPMEGALCSGAVTERPAGAAGEKAAGDIMVNISKGSKSEGRQGRSAQIGRGVSQPT